MKKISKRQNIKDLWKGKYLSVKLLDDWYEYLHNGNGKFVVVLGYKRIGKDAWKYLGRYENCPPHNDGISLCALTGGIDDDNEKPEKAALRELQEESGIDSKKYKLELENLGTVRPSKASDSIAHLFAVDLQNVPDKDMYVGKGDGTKGEQGSYCKWVDSQTVKNSKDPLLITCFAKLGF